MIFELKKGGLRASARTLGGELVSLRDGDGLELAQPRHPQMEFHMRLPRQVPPLSIVRACRPSS